MLASIKIRTVAAIALGIAAPYAAATNGDQLLGYTAIQNGMAGAVVAAPQDAATILVNPAGMAELDIKEVRFDLGLGFLNPPRSVNGFDSDSDLYAIPGGSVAFRVNDKLTLGMGLGGWRHRASTFPIPMLRRPAISSR
jgi:long-chain fatty acid transport protein